MKSWGKWVSYIILGLVIVFFALALIVPKIYTGHLAIVRSSSMEPAIQAGSLALMMPVDPLKVRVGDIIVFAPWNDPDVTVSHRVIGRFYEEGELYFATKGDAVEDPDPDAVPAENVKGKVIFDIPYLGFAANYMYDYVRSWWGLIVFVALPAMLLVGITIRDINRARNRRYKRMQLWLKRRQQRR